jgi:hypothetical protein
VLIAPNSPKGRLVVKSRMTPLPLAHLSAGDVANEVAFAKGGGGASVSIVAEESAEVRFVDAALLRADSMIDPFVIYRWGGEGCHELYRFVAVELAQRLRALDELAHSTAYLNEKEKENDRVRTQFST